MRILLLNYETALGSAVHATPVFAALRAAKPDWEIHVAAAGIAYDVLADNPHIDKIWHTPHAINETSKAMRWFLVNRWRLGRFDRVIFNTGNSRTKINFLSRIINSQSRDGFSVKPSLVNQLLVEDEAISLIDNNLKVLDVFGLSGPTSNSPEIWVSPTEAENALSWRRNVCLVSNDTPLIGFFAGTSGGHPNQWYDERFIEVSNALFNACGAKSVFFGGPRDAEHATGLAAACEGEALAWAGKTTVRQSAACCAVCDLVISVDTGGMHVAWAVNTPLIVLGHAANPYHIWLPKNNANVMVIRKDEKVLCALCRKHSCDTRECMDEIKTFEVINAALLQLEKFKPTETLRLKRLEQCTAKALTIEV